MTREEAKRTLEDLREYKIVLSDIPFNDQEKICDLAISALSTEGEYIKKEDALKALHDFWDECIGYDGSGTEMMLDNESIINSLQTYSFPNSADDNTMEWIYEGDEISGVFKCSKCGMESEDMDFEHFHFCPNCGRKAVNK